MAQAEGKSFTFQDHSHIDTPCLETFPYDGQRQYIQYRYPEFNAVCPFSGLPDIGTVILEYIPAAQLVELKSYKYYLVSFRNVGIYQEQATSRIFEDMWQALQPEYLKVTTLYNTRGGIDAACVVEKGSREPYTEPILSVQS